MKISYRLVCQTGILVSLILLSACSSDDGNNAPIADAGLDQTVRAMSKVLLSSRNSDDPDGVILSHDWRQIGGPAVSLIKKTVNTVSFDVPALQSQTDFVFEVSVTDNRQSTTSDTVTITALPINDQDRFLTYINTPDTFKIVAATFATNTFATDESFTVTVVTRAVYVDNFGVDRNITLDTTTKAGRWLAAAGSTGTDYSTDPNDVAMAYNNPQLTFSVPKVNIESIQRKVAEIDPGDDGGIDDGEGDRIVLQLDITLISDSGAIDTYLYILDDENNIIAENDVSGDSLQSGLTIEASLLTSSVMNRQVENLATAQAYYDAVDPDNDKTILADWLTANDFPADCDADPNCFHTRYINNYDLAFGRDMFVYTDPINNNVLSYVINYPNFDTMIEGIKRIAVVAMEYSPGPANGVPFTKFYTFVVNPLTGKQERVLSMDFDGRGEKFMPGVCAVCHGGRPNDLVAGVYPNEGDIDARFLPWDIDTLVFSDAEFDGNPNAVPLENIPRAQLDSIHATIKGFNQAVLLTNPSVAARELIEGWYGGSGLPDTEFDGTFVPGAWENGLVMTDSAGSPLGVDDSGNICTSPGIGLCVETNNPVDSETIYHEVIGPYCRSCHTVGGRFPAFETYGEFAKEKNFSIKNRVFNEGIMPMSRRTMDQFWVPASGNSEAAATVLAEHLNVALPEQGPSRVIAAINDSDADITVAGVRNDDVRLNAVGSQYGRSFSWLLQVPANSNAVLVGADTQNPAFRTDAFGKYIVTLTVSNDFGIDTVKRTITVPHLIPSAVDDQVSVKQDSQILFDPLGNDTLGDEPTTIITASSSSNGTVTIDASSTKISYIPDNNFSGSDNFTYTISDIDGDQSTATVTVTVSGLPGADNDTFNIKIDDPETALSIFATDNLGVEPTSVSLVSGLSEGGSITGFDSVISQSSTIAYTPDGCVNNPTDSFGYTITDGNGDESSATVTIKFTETKSFKTLLNGVFNSNCQICHRTGGFAASTGLLFDTQVYENVKSRINDCSNPKGSLILMKGTNQTSHGGGDKLGGTGSTGYKDILRWIQEGVRNN